MGRTGKCLAVTGALSTWLAVASGFAADPANDPYTFYGVAQPQGPATASYLRMHHPLYLLDRCRQVKAGRLGREKVEGLVGHHALDALLAMDLDALYRRLTDPAAGPPVVPPVGGPPARSLWHRILTNEETAPPPPPDLPSVLDFNEVGRGDSPTRTFRVTSPTDGLLEATLPAGSPYQILSMQTYTGVMVSLPAMPRRPKPPFTRRGEAGEDAAFHGPAIERARTYRVPELARRQLPTQVPVQAGQDVDIEVGLPTAPAVAPGGTISSTITVGDPVQGSWRQDVPILAQAALKGDIKIIIGQPQPFFDVVEEGSLPNVPIQFVVPLTLSKPNPPVAVKGIIEPYSLPQGVSMPTIGFALQPNQTLNVSVPVYVAIGSPAELAQEVPQSFSMQVSYHTTSVPLASRKEVAEFVFTLYPSVQTWRVSAKPGGVECIQDVAVYSSGWTIRSGECDNRNAYSANVAAIGTLASVGNVVQNIYHLGWFDQKFTSSAGSIPFFQSNYVYVRGQPLLVTWNKY